MIQKINKPWGYELIWAKTDKYVGKILHINAGQALSLQYHNVKDETIMVQYGRIQLEYYSRFESSRNRRILDMVPGDSFRIKPDTVHRMTACQEAEIVEVSTPELDDVVRLEDRYGRTANRATQSFIGRFFSWVFNSKNKIKRTSSSWKDLDKQ